jgi:membrane-associated protease RseP (regulator of RpoE activity)
MNITAELTPLFLVVTLGFLAWGLWRARQRGKAALLIWLQGLMLVLPWVVFLLLLSFGIYLNIAGFILLLVVFTGIYIWVGRKARQVAEQESQARRSEPLQSSPAPMAGEAATPQGSAPPVMTAIPPLSSADLEAIRSIFSVDSFFATETIPYGEGAIFQGNLRLDPEGALERLTQKLQEAVGDRYRLYLVENSEEKPAVVVLPTSVVHQSTALGAKVLSVGLLIASVLSLLEVGANLAGFSVMTTPARWLQALPIAVGILATVVIHEVGHRWMASRYGVRLSPAFMIPTLGIGTLGTLNRIESPLPNRKALFDIAFAGPAAGGLVSLAVLILGLTLSAQSVGVLLPAAIFRSSILVGTLAKLVLGTDFQSEAIAVHPLVVVGWIGLGITALSLLPAGQLDGGRIVQAVYGRKTAGRTTFVTLIFLGISALSNLIALYWALLILFIAREPERPPLNEISETDGQRDALALLALFLMAMTLLPIAPALAGVLHFPN